MKRIVEEFKIRSKIYEEDTLTKSFFNECDINRLRARNQKRKLGIEYSRMCEKDDDFLKIIVDNDLLKLDKGRKLDIEQEIIEMTKENLRPRNRKEIAGVAFMLISILVTSFLDVSIGFILIFGVISFVAGYLLESFFFRFRLKNHRYATEQSYNQLFSSILKVVNKYLKEFKFDLNSRRLIINEFLNYSRKLLKISKNEKFCEKISKFQKKFCGVIFSKESEDGLTLTWKLLLKLNDFEIEKGFRNGFPASTKNYGNYTFFVKRKFQEIFSPLEIFGKFHENKSRGMKQLLLEVKEFKKVLVEDLRNMEEQYQNLDSDKEDLILENKLRVETIKVFSKEEYPFSENKLLIKKNGLMEKSKITKIELYKLLQMFFAYDREIQFRRNKNKKEKSLDFLSNLSPLELSLSHFSEDLMASEYPNIFYPQKVLTTEFIKTTQKNLESDTSGKKVVYASTDGNDGPTGDPGAQNTDRGCVEENVFISPKSLLLSKRKTAAGRSLCKMSMFA